MKYRNFIPGDKVKTVFGQVRTVLLQRECQVFVAEECDRWYHPNKLWKLEGR